jgi:hypothetical protein
MADRHYLVVARDAEAQKRITLRIRAGGGIVLASLPSLAVIARLGDQAKEELTASGDVRHCGAVEISPRPIRRIRVGPDGTHVTA